MLSVIFISSNKLEITFIRWHLTIQGLYKRKYFIFTWDYWLKKPHFNDSRHTLYYKYSKKDIDKNKLIYFEPNNKIKSF